MVLGIRVQTPNVVVDFSSYVIHIFTLLVPLPSSTLILIFSEMLKFSKIISSKSKKYCEGKIVNI
jgi:hypothetical protein